MKRKLSILFVIALICFLNVQKTFAQVTVFSEDWTSNSFTTNGWTFSPSQGNWSMGAAYTPAGATSPNAYFDWSPTLTNYSHSLVSPIINGALYINMTLDYKLLLNNFSTSTLEEFKVEYKPVSSGTWTTLASYNNSAGVATFNYPVVNMPLPAVNMNNFQLRFTAFGPNSFNINGWGVDDIKVKGIYGTPCSGQPVAGTIAVTGSCPTVISASGITMAANTHIQWQKKTVCGGSWVDIPNDTGYYKTITSLAQATLFREYIICYNSGLTDTSNQLLLSSVAPCYCNNSAATNASNEDIYRVTVGNFDNPSSCATTGGPGSILNKYSNYTTILPSIKLNKGGTYPIAIEVGTCSNASTNGVKAWVDWGQDGSFDDATDTILISPVSSIGPHIETGTFTVPSNPNIIKEGLTRMRVIVANNSTPSTINSCGGYTYGETEDYDVVIQYAPTISGPGIDPITHFGSFCSGQNVVLNASAPGISSNYHYLWQKSDGTFIYDSTSIHINNIVAGLPLPGGLGGQAGVYKLFIIVDPCAGGSPDTSGAGSVILSITPTPPMPIVNSNIVFCLGAPFDSIPIYGAGLKWYAQPNGGIPMFVAPIVNTNVTGTATYYVSQNVNGCEGPRKKVSLTVAPKPAPPTVVSPVVYCQGDTPDQLHASGVNIKWYPVSTGGLGTSIIPTPGTNAQGIFTWYVTQSVAGCESNRVPVNVRINYIPNALIQIHKQYVCQYDTMHLSYFGNATPTADYLWGLPNGANVLSGSGQGPLVIRFDSAGYRRVFLQVDNGGCKGPTTYLDIEVRPLPQLTLDLQSDACIGDITNLSIAWSSLSVDKYNWDFDGASQAYGVNPSGPYGLVWNTSGDKIITLIATDNDCDSRPIHDTIKVHPNPDAHITDVNGKSICTGDSVLLQAVYYPDATYRWQPEQFFRAEQTNMEYAKVDKNSAWIYLTITSEYNCKGKDSIRINSQPCCRVLVPTAFTPNGDGKNDVFNMIKYNGNAATVGNGNVLTGGSVSISVFEIFNRWGQIIFQSADDRIGWDGTSNGVAQDAGVYSYHIRYKCADGNFYEEKGDVTLLR